MKRTCTPTEHYGAKLDAFAQLVGVKRSTPGDCICATCGAPIPYKWNGGRPFQVLPSPPDSVVEFMAEEGTNEKVSKTPQRVIIKKM